MNYSQFFVNASNTVNNCVSPKECFDTCIAEMPQYQTQFVWVFILAFMFHELSSLVFHLKMENTQMKLSLIAGLKWASYILNMGGIAYYLIWVI